MKLFQGFGGFASTLSLLPPPVEAFDYINKLTISAASSANIDNVFSSDYDHYLLLQDLDGTQNSQEIELRLRSSGSNSSASYNRQRIAFDGTLSGGRVTAANSIIWTWNSGTASDANPPVGWMMISNPFQSVITTGFSYGTILFEEPSNSRTYLHWHSHGITTSYDGFGVLTTGGTLTGSIEVYGWKV